MRADLESVARVAAGPGALVVNLRNILEAMAPVAAAQPVRIRSRREVEAEPASR